MKDYVWTKLYEDKNLYKRKNLTIYEIGSGFWFREVWLVGWDLL